MRRLGLICLPLAFLLAGAGMLMLRLVETAAGSFYEQIVAEHEAWITAHVILLAGTTLLLPAALSLRTAIRPGPAAWVGTAMVVVIAPTSLLLAGQYAIDFLTPAVAEVGGDAIRAKELAMESSLVSVLFYGLPNLVFLALMILMFAAIGSVGLSRVQVGALVLVWVVVLVGNLVHPVVQRVGIMVLGLVSLPMVRGGWSEERRLY